MKKVKYIYIFVLFIFISCKQTPEVDTPKIIDKKVSDTSIEKNVCICDSAGFFETNGKLETYCYEGSSLVKIAHYPNSDTMDVRRYANYRYLEEAIEVLDNKLVNTEYAMYCDIKDTLNFYKLTFFNNDFMYEDQGVKIHRELGVELVCNQDTIKSNTNSVLVPKEKFNGKVVLDKITDATHTRKGFRRIERQSIHIETKYYKTYGNLLEQFKAIKKNCDLLH